MKFKQSLLAAAVVLATVPAFAHISYTGRDFGSFDGVSTTTGNIVGKTVTSNAGWADAADNAGSDALTWGDSHKAAAFTFVLTASSSVTFSAMANAGVVSALGGLLPGFSIYEGKASVTPRAGTQTSADYDTSLASLAYRATLPGGSAAYSGVWNAMGDWKVGGDGDVPGAFSELTSFMYKGSAFATSGTSASGTFLLGPGTYSVFVGGNDFGNYGSPLKYGLDTSISVTAVPEPETYAMLLAGLALIGGIAKRRKARAA